MERLSNTRQVLPVVPSQVTCAGHAELVDELRKATDAQTTTLDELQKQGERLKVVETSLAKVLNLKYWLGGIIAAFELFKNHDPVTVITQVIKSLVGG